MSDINHTQNANNADNISISGSQSTPSVEGNGALGLLRMQGDSYPENSFEFFGPIIEWLERLLKETQLPLRLELRLVYMNTSSVKAMMDIFDLLEEVADLLHDEYQNNYQPRQSCHHGLLFSFCPFQNKAQH